MRHTSQHAPVTVRNHTAVGALVQSTYDQTGIKKTNASIKWFVPNAYALASLVMQCQTLAKRGRWWTRPGWRAA